jgi:glycosyltransferase 2 family protein
MTDRTKNVVSFLLRLGLSAVCLGVLFRYYIDWDDILRVVKGADVHLLWLAFGVNFLITIILLIRWYLIMFALGLKAPIGMVFRYFFIGIFCNLFLPTSIGGDLVKAIGLSRRVGQKPKVFASVVLDRLSGFAGMVIIAILAYSIGSRFIDAPSVIVPISILAVTSLAVGGMLFHKPTYAFFCEVFRHFPRIHKALMDMHADVMLMRGKKRTGWGCVFLSSGIQVIAAYMYFLIATALHIKARMLYFVIFGPIVGAVTMLPSLGGLGVREAGWVYFLAKVGVDKGAAAGLSLISFAFVIIVGLLGGLIYVSTSPAGRVQRAQEDPPVR